MQPNLTQLAQLTLQQALEIASTHHNPSLDDLHLLAALLTVDGMSRDLVKEIVKNGEFTVLQEQVAAAILRLPTSEPPPTSNQPHLSSILADIIKKANDHAQKLNNGFLSQDLLLLALTEVASVSKNILYQSNVNTANIREKIMATHADNRSHNPESHDAQYKVLEKYTTDITALAKEGKLDPVIGRETEIRRAMQVLSRRTKNNPVLVGEPGVGKTAVVEGLALRIVNGDVPESLKNKRLLSLEISSLLAGAKFRGEFEERMKGVIDEAVKSEGQIILFIDELHTIVGAGAGEGSTDAGNMMKPALARGALRVIGATTLNEYRKYIEKDSALERRFQPVPVNAPSVEDTISILRGLKEKYELHHGIRITDDALVAAAKLSDRYIADRFLPDKAIDLVDEAASSLKIETESDPVAIDTLQRKVTQLEIEEKALKKEKSEEAKDRLKAIQDELSNYREQLQQLKHRWESQKKILDELQSLRQQVDQLRVDLEHAERNIELDKAAEIKYGKIPELEQKAKDAETQWAEIPTEEKLLKEEVSAEDIATVVARWSGIPVKRLIKTEQQQLLHLEEELAKRVIGQEDAITAVANAVRRSRAGIADANKPTATFMFLGPTGVGKTETAKALAEILFNDERAIIRMDMSEYSEPHTVARLIGAPPGYVGYEEGGQLTEAVRRRPYSVVLFDEVEKAHPQIFNIFLQIFDDGRLTDGKGRSVDFRNTILIMTSNVGAHLIQEAMKKGTKLKSAEKKVLNENIWELLQTNFKPEFLNRIDQVIFFESLTETQIQEIVDVQLSQVEKRLKEQNVSLIITDEAKKLLANKGFDPVFGARPLRRVIQQEILNPLALMILDREDDSFLPVQITTDGDTLTVKKSD